MYWVSDHCCAYKDPLIPPTVLENIPGNPVCALVNRNAVVGSLARSERVSVSPKSSNFLQPEAASSATAIEKTKIDFKYVSFIMLILNVQIKNSVLNLHQLTLYRASGHLLQIHHSLQMDQSLWSWHISAINCGQ